MRFHLLMISGMLASVFANSLHAQSIIAPRPFDLTFANSTIGTLMPGYDLGVDSEGRSAFQDDLDNVGASWELKAVRRFLHTRTSFETRIFYGLSLSNQTQSPSDVDVFNPIDGSSNAFTGGRAHLGGDLQLYGGDFTIKDTWQTRFGGLSAGMAFSYLAFDQSFDADYNGVRLLSEDLNSDFLGGKGVFGWEGFVFGRPTNLDLGFGYYDLEADYRFDGGAVAGSLSKDFSDHSGTIDFNWTTWTQLGRFYTGLSIGGMYISDMPKIQHNSGSQVSISTDDAALLNASVQILL
jgi:hypothetical protein